MNNRRIFLSFLGNGSYEETRYVETSSDEMSVSPLRFIQEACILKFCSEYTQQDVIYVFTTNGSLVNWNDGDHKEFRTNQTIWYEGLKTRLSSIGLKCSIQNVMIPEGKSTEEIWQIFEIVFNVINRKDEITFDITHGFRSLPMLNMVLINYAKLLKQIHVFGIYYGAYEARYKSGDKEYSPIWNLKDFEVLQEWTNQANIFLKTGNAIPLVSLFGNQKEMVDLGQNLTEFSKFIMVNRGLDILDGSAMVNLHEGLGSYFAAGNTNIAALTPILDKIKDEFKSYQLNSVWNGFIAVRWCITNGLIQQAATLLEEFIITFVILELGQQIHMKNNQIRTTVSSALTIGSSEKYRYAESPNMLNLREWQLSNVEKIRNLPYKKKLRKILSDLKAVRNDINHAGFRENARRFDDLQLSISKRYSEVRNLLNLLHPYLDLPTL